VAVFDAEFLQALLGFADLRQFLKRRLAVLVLTQIDVA
jgi:hypothetical protein